MRKYKSCAFKNRIRKILLAATALAGVLVMFMQTLKIQTIYQYLSAKSGRQFLTRAGNVLDLPARRAGIVLHFVSIAVYSTYCCAHVCVYMCLLYGRGGVQHSHVHVHVHVHVHGTVHDYACLHVRVRTLFVRLTASVARLRMSSGRYHGWSIRSASAGGGGSGTSSESHNNNTFNQT